MHRANREAEMPRRRQGTTYRDTGYSVESGPSLRVRLVRFVGWIGGLFAVTVAILVTQRLSQDSLALIVGLSCGIAAMLPTLALGVFLWRRETLRCEASLRQRQMPQARRSSPNPSIIVVSPPGAQGYGSPQSMLPDYQNPWRWNGSQGERDFKIIGQPD